MIRNRFLLSILMLLGVVHSGYAQSTMNLRIMTYNLLGYPVSFTTADTRYNDLKPILQYIQPDIVSVNELKDNGDDRFADTLLVRSFLPSGVAPYTHADMITPSGDLNNMLFYNTDKLLLVSHTETYAPVRNFDHYRLLVLDPDLSCHHDSTFISVITIHMKASNTTADATTRGDEATAIKNYMNASIPSSDNVFVCGDLNLYDETEIAYTTLDGAGAVHDLTDVLGPWTRNDISSINSFTQSTRSTANPGGSGGVTGGLDDRFDFIWMNQNLLSGAQNCDYVSNSMSIFGNDALHFNLAIIESPPNAVISTSLANNVFNMSDHYPVYGDFLCTFPTVTAWAVAGSSTACASSNQTYSVPAGAGCTYNWIISNGTILSGQGTSSVVVQWTNGSSAGNISCEYSCP